MEHLTFLFNLLIIIIFTVDITLYFGLYITQKSPFDFWVMILFISYLLDNMILYAASFIESFDLFYSDQIVTAPVIKTLISVITFLAYSMMIQHFFNRPQTLTEKILLGTFVLALLLLPAFFTTKISFFLYFTFSQLLFYYYWAVVNSQLRKRAKEGNKSKLAQALMLLCFMLNTGIIIEDGIVIFGFDSISFMNRRIRQRNTMEDLLSILFAAIGIWYGGRQILQAINSNKTVKKAPLPENTPPTEQHAQAEEKALTYFYQEYGFTQREKEIFRLLLEDKTNQEIADQLFISYGTVKNHIHNIYQRIGVTRRSQAVNMVYELVARGKE